MNHLIEPMAIGDFEEVIALWRVTDGVGLNESDGRENVAYFLERNAGLSFVARDGQRKIIGAVLCGHDGRRGYLHHLAVAKEHRRQGIGRRLVDACLAKLAALGLHKCNIFIYADNIPGKAFWEHHDWKERADLCLMQKMITSQV